LLKALSLVYPDLAKKTVHISHGMLRLPSGKMSSRTGQVITSEFLLGEIKKLVFEKIKDRDMSDKEKEEVAEKVSVGALKYSILKQTAGKDIIFDFDKSLSFEGDSGPYLQYSYARAKSILRKAESENIKSDFKNNSEINELEKMIYRFSEIVERAGDEYSPHNIASYLIELSSAFNSFYAKGKIVDKTDENSPYKIALTESFSIILKNGLNLLGISTPEKM
jgi:arginyl-tRNA synthetase